MSSIRRRLPDGRVCCDLCQDAPATERHHIVTRYAVMGNKEAWEWADHHLLTTLLCRDCHEWADVPDIRDKILVGLYEINGRGDREKGYLMVKHIFDKVAAMVTLSWELPSWQ